MLRADTGLLTLTIAVVAGIVVGLAGCGGSTGGTLASGRVISASSDTFSIGQSNDADTATLTLGSTTVIVEPKRVVIDGQPAVRLNPQTKRVQVTRASHKLRVVADGAIVYDAPIRK